MKVITYHIELLEPVLVTGLEGDPNSAVTYPFLPGSVLRGALIGRYLRQLGRDELGAEPASWDLERRLFLSGVTHFLNGYPVQSYNGKKLRSLPSPRSWHRPKEERQYNPAPCVSGGEHPSVYCKDFAIELPEIEDTTQWVTAGKEFLVAEEQSPFFVEPLRQVRIETSRHRDYGRARAGGTEDEPTGAVYRYEALAADQTFAAHIICDDGDAEQLGALIEGVFYLGGARSADYGRSRLMLIETQELTNWSETAHAELPQDELRENTAIITLLSDLLWRNLYGQYAVDPHALADHLKLKLDRAFVRACEIGGFNRKWGLPLPQASAFQMGSVLVFKNVPPEDMTQLKQYAIVGLGDRREDGFGRIAVNWHGAAELGSLSDLESERPKDIMLDGKESHSVAGQMTRRLVLKQIAQRISARANELARPQRGLSKSQIYRLQLAILSSLQLVQANERADLAKERAGVTKYLESLQARRSTREQFDRARIDGEKFLVWIDARVKETDRDKTFEMIRYQETTVIGGVAAALDDRDFYLINLQLINAVLARLGKKALEED